jgi:hypothetical protein
MARTSGNAAAGREQRDVDAVKRTLGEPSITTGLPRKATVLPAERARQRRELADTEIASVRWR